ncbi:cell division protein SepF [Amycolatopsis taiwanensis]|uniref:Cell division protein SepF n=1 Tax=Amycolatopsis taiwanensis TaxID=342230 RepID=A0A9W6VJD5_9PSEU|nr:cell division protein SepF [Amycolatopsis taiwanensis]GLY69414.1 cell division protein SepF [Amycolatopsis taiwanensis]
MSALQKLKAYFGMIPADSDEYDEYDGDRDYRRDYADEGYDGYEEESRPPRRHRSDYSADPVPRARGREPAVHGSLAVDRQPEPVARLRTVPEEARMTAHRDPLSRITTLHPTSYFEARAIGEAYRDGIPVIINLTEMDNADAKRLVDFAAGLAFALRGSMDKVTTKVFLLSPPDVEVTAEDRRRIAEGGLFRRH